MSKWINVKDSLPEKEGHYLVFTKDNNTYVCEYFSICSKKKCPPEFNVYCDCTYSEGSYFHHNDVTYWMELPEDPKDEG